MKLRATSHAAYPAIPVRIYPAATAVACGLSCIRSRLAHSMRRPQIRNPKSAISLMSSFVNGTGFVIVTLPVDELAERRQVFQADAVIRIRLFCLVRNVRQIVFALQLPGHVGIDVLDVVVRSEEHTS